MFCKMTVRWLCVCARQSWPIPICNWPRTSKTIPVLTEISEEVSVVAQRAWLEKAHFSSVNAATKKRIVHFQPDMISGLWSNTLLA